MDVNGNHCDQEAYLMIFRQFGGLFESMKNFSLDHYFDPKMMLYVPSKKPREIQVRKSEFEIIQKLFNTAVGVLSTNSPPKWPHVLTQVRKSFEICKVKLVQFADQCPQLKISIISFVNTLDFNFPVIFNVVKENHSTERTPEIMRLNRHSETIISNVDKMNEAKREVQSLKAALEVLKKEKASTERILQATKNLEEATNQLNGLDFQIKTTCQEVADFFDIKKHNLVKVTPEEVVEHIKEYIKEYLEHSTPIEGK